MARWRSYLAGAALVVLTLAAYSAAIGNGFIWDDDFYVTDNLTLRSLDGLRHIWLERGAVPQYYPLAHTSFWIEYHLWGLYAPAYHAVNVALQALAVVLVWRLLLRLAVPGAWLAAAIFAVHPVEVESVAWITERKNVLSLVLALAAMLAYLRFAPPEEDTPLAGRDAATPRWRWYALALVLFVAALLAKTVTVSVPAVLLVIYWWKRGRVGLADAALLAPFFLVAVALAGVTVSMEKALGAEGQDWNLGAIERLLVAGRALWFYAGKLVWPADLNFFYHRWKVDPHQWWQYLYPAAAVAVIVGLWLARGRIGRGPLAAVLIFAGVLVPALGFFDVYPFRYSFVADHFQYHASIALVALAAAAVATWYARTRPPPKLAATVTVAGALVALGVLTWARTGDYKDFGTLFQDIVAKDPESWIGHNNLGALYLKNGRAVLAIPHFEEAIRLRPDYTETYNNLALALADQGAYAEALLRLEEALRLKPDDYNAHNNMAWILATCRDESRRDPARAVTMAREAVRLAPGTAACWGTLGVALYRAGDWQGAEGALKKSIALRVDEDPADYFFLAMALQRLGQTAEARRAYDHGAALIRLQPEDTDTAAFYDEATTALGLKLRRRPPSSVFNKAGDDCAVAPAAAPNSPR